MVKALGKRLWLVAGTVIVTVAIVVLGVNFSSGEKKIERRTPADCQS